MVSAALCGCSKQDDQHKITVPEPITICQGGETPVQAYVAAANGDFAKEGLDVVIRKLGDGKTAMNAVLAGDCTFGAGIGEPPVVAQSYARDDFSILGALESSDNFARIVARKDRGISRAEDLKGKRLGLKKGVTSHIFAGVLLQKHGLKFSDLDIRFMELKDMPNALALGDVDAFASSEFYFLEGKRKLGANAVVLEDPGLLKINSYFIAKKAFIAQKPETVKKVFRALLRAEKLIATNPSDASAKLAAASDLPAKDAAEVISKKKHSMTLSTEQLRSMELNSDWMMDNGMLEKRPANNFRRLIDERFLKELSPATVTLGN
jgi:NitT/TauT family transport system substrate-binding protein